MSVEVQKAIIGGILASPDLFTQAAADLSAAHFSDAVCRDVFTAFAELTAKELKIDRPTVLHWTQGKVAESDIQALDHIYPIASEITQHIQLIKEAHGKRQLEEAARQVQQLANKSQGQTLEHVIEEANAVLTRALEIDTGKSHTRSYEQILPDYLKDLHERAEKEGDVSGVTTGFRDLDALTNGFMPGQLIILAARPAMGKSAAMLQSAEKSAKESGSHTLIFSLEMKGEELIQRSVASQAEIHMGHLKSGSLSDEEADRLESHYDTIKATRVIINDMQEATPARIRAEALKVKRSLQSRGEKLGMIAVDYLQLMNDTGFGPTDRASEVSSISRKLKKLAGELEIPVLALSQLNRQLEQRPNKRPMPSDLRESGSLEQDADLILFLYRDEIYFPDADNKGKAELIIAKQRSGSLGTVNLMFQGEYSRFLDLKPTGQIPLAAIGDPTQRPTDAPEGPSEPMPGATVVDEPVF